MKEVILIIGGNVGDRIALLSEAKSKLMLKIGQLKDKSAVYETQAWGGKSKGDYLNQILIFETDFDAEYILDIALKVEKELGRERDVKWGNRTMDIDILYFGNEIINKHNLIVPHPYIAERRFVLVPLDEILPNFIHPVFNLTNKQLLDRCTDFCKVSKVE
ncbi:2-amino-4-hydroxy-6-hydroxymethyldihydropteridine diphosphokinase [Belliella sp. DSM 107340]|uniref:2-amino-4-hydroxy-6-hydroxymethyldihydropteridine pyrophosphokinase n=1 Tax=Belliella calami TaxID=2923436 RepID=A0ABS9UKV9_9BACT|nr:2-amino-4-hydroxy-6-hydroxymethyldihydropteridine diphosphokinase [Belliella calami]MCH7396805.1 2-amino-4-hydroxy-6-hydroxymethyldihydropteridine diphosphokinase [Belliella calami]